MKKNQKKLTLYIGSDHAGVELKKALQKKLPQFTWKDLGPKNSSRVDYPDYAAKVSHAVVREKGKAMGILICGSGIGMSISANKVQGIRAALVENPVSARLSREHNDSNVLCLGARFLAEDYAAEIVECWATTSFSKDSRHQGRISKIHSIEGKTKND